MARLVTPAELSSLHALGPAGIRRWVREKRLVPVRRGHYLLLERGEAAPTDAAARHRLLIEATASLLAPDTVVSHASAAVLHGIPVETALLARVWGTRARSTGKASRVFVGSQARLVPEDVIEVDGRRVTSLARTVVDLGRIRPLDCIVAADAALKQGVDAAGVAAALERAHHAPGIRRARRAWALGDGRSESVGEGRSRGVFDLAGIPAPELQREIRDASGRLLARVDFAWEEFNTLGEFDGAVKYGPLVPEGLTPQQVLMAEKRREQRLHEQLWWVVRWDWAELDRPAALAAKLRAGFAIGQRLRAKLN